VSGARVAAGLALLAVAVVSVLLLRGDDDGTLVRAEFASVGGLREGSKVQVDGVPVGTVENIELARGDRALVEARIEDSAAPLGAGARAKVRAANLLGEKYLDLERGDARRGGAGVIPMSRTGVAVELDDVLNALDVPTRAALQVVLNESGRAMTGRGRDLAAMLKLLPNGLDTTGELLTQLSADNRALGRLVDESDRVVGAVAPERRELVRLVDGAAATLEAVATRRRKLGATVREAPGTLAALRRALVALDSAAVPLAPAARGLARTAPQLTATLKQLRPFADAARPTLRTARNVSATLTTLGRRGTPLVRRVRPLAGELRSFGDETGPIAGELDEGIHDTLGVVEGWARATAPHDGASHVFRAGLTVGADMFDLLLEPAPQRRRKSRPQQQRPQQSATPPQTARPKLPSVELPRLPKLPKVLPNQPEVDVNQVTDDVQALLDYLLAP